MVSRFLQVPDRNGLGWVVGWSPKHNGSGLPSKHRGMTGRANRTHLDAEPLGIFLIPIISLIKNSIGLTVALTALENSYSKAVLFENCQRIIGRDASFSPFILGKFSNQEDSLTRKPLLHMTCAH